MSKFSELWAFGGLIIVLLSALSVLDGVDLASIYLLLMGWFMVWSGTATA